MNTRNGGEPVDSNAAPHEGGPWAVADLACVWAKRGAIAIVIAFLIGFIGHQLGVL